MMKKLVTFCIALLMSCTFAQAQLVRIPFIVQTIFDGPIGNQMPRGPIKPPMVYLEDMTLTFVADHPEYVLYIKDEDEEVVYSAVVTSTETEVTLPSSLCGTYEIQLVMGNWMFTGWIEL